MPCKDVTEIIEVVVDAQDTLKNYRFIKRTCGQGVGLDCLLLPVLQGKAVEDILSIAPEDFTATHPVEEAVEEFLQLKHLIAVQSALEVLTGREDCGPEALCAAAEISCDGLDTSIEAVIKVDLVTEAIKSCGGCKGCGKPRKRAAAPIFN